MDSSDESPFKSSIHPAQLSSKFSATSSKYTVKTSSLFIPKQRDSPSVSLAKINHTLSNDRLVKSLPSEVKSRLKSKQQELELLLQFEKLHIHTKPETPKQARIKLIDFEQAKEIASQTSVFESRYQEDLKVLNTVESDTSSESEVESLCSDSDLEPDR